MDHATRRLHRIQRIQVIFRKCESDTGHAAHGTNSRWCKVKKDMPKDVIVVDVGDGSCDSSSTSDSGLGLLPAQRSWIQNVYKV